MSTNNMSVREINANAKSAKVNAKNMVDNAVNSVLSPFSVINQIRKEGGEEFTNFLQFIGLTRKAFGLNVETFGEHFLQLEGGCKLVWDADSAKKLLAKEVAKLRKAIATKDANKIDKAQTKYDEYKQNNLLYLDGVRYVLVTPSVSNYKKLLTNVIDAKKADLLANSSEAKKRAEKAAKKAQKDAEKAAKARELEINILRNALLCENVSLSHNEATQKATEMYNKLHVA